MNHNIGGDLFSKLKSEFTEFEIKKEKEQQSLTVFTIDPSKKEDISGGGITIRMVGEEKGHLFAGFGSKFGTPPSCDYMYLKPAKDGGGLNIYLIEQTDLETMFYHQMNVEMTKNIPINKIVNYFQKTGINGEISSSSMRRALEDPLKEEWRNMAPHILTSYLVQHNLSKYISSVAMTFWYQLKSDYHNLFPKKQNYYFVLLDIPGSKKAQRSGQPVIVNKPGLIAARQRSRRVLKRDFELCKKDIHQNLDISIGKNITGNVAPFRISVGGLVLGYKGLKEHIQIH